MRTAVLLSALLLALAVLPDAYSYSSISVNNPQTGKWGNGTIESAVMAMTPNGEFMKYDVTMTFSARGQQAFAQTESLEVSYSFSLPADAVVNDLYLWVGNEISRGLILDRATASATYEGIVKRRRDPAFLQKTYQDQYRLQIYPMAANGTRTVRFTFIVPLTKSADAWSVPVPSDLFTGSSTQLQSLRLVYYAPSASHVPVLNGAGGLAFTPWADSLSQSNVWKCDIPNSSFITANPVVAVPVPTGREVLVTRFADARGGGVYHVMLDPFRALGISNARKFIIAFDYDSVKTTLTRNAYIESIMTMLRTSYTAKDSFNIIFNSWQRSGEGWFAADSAGISAAFRMMGAQTITNGSDIPGLFMNCVEFLNTHPGAAGILLIAASDKLSTPAQADPVLGWLGTKLPKGVPVHVVNTMNRNYVYYYAGASGGWAIYSSNAYFYEGLKSLTGGTVRNATAEALLPTVLGNITPLLRTGLTSLDIQVRFANGFTYSQRSYGIVPFQPLYVSQPAGQIGRFSGGGAMSVEVAGFFDNQPYYTRIAVPDSIILPSDSTLRAVWAGKYISDIEWDYNTPDAQKQIIDACIAERVVCRYTALLALEPGDTIRYAKNITTGPVLTEVERAKSAVQTYEIASAYPNPFNPSTTLRVHLPEGVRAQNVTLAVYNLLGQKVKTFDASMLNASGATEFRWDGTDDAGRRAASGMYLFVVSAPGVRHTVKLMLLK